MPIYRMPSYKVTELPHTISLEVEKKLSKGLFFEAGFNHIVSRTSEPSTIAKDNMIFAGLRYSH